MLFWRTSRLLACTYRRLARLQRGLRADDRDDMTMRPRDVLLRRWQRGRAFGICEWLDLRYCQWEFARFGSSSVLLQDCSDELRTSGVITDSRWIFADWRLIRTILAVSRDIGVPVVWASSVFFVRISSLRHCTVEAVNARTTPQNSRFCDFAAIGSYCHLE